MNAAVIDGGETSVDKIFSELSDCINIQRE
jgi:hypothetical protein